MNAAGQALIEFVILTAIFMLLLAGIARKMPLTMNQSTPYLGAQVEARLQTGVGFAKSGSQQTWSQPIKPKGGLNDPQ